MKVSIITATYNSEKTVGDCLQSVLNQDYKDIEYIVIDGASKDDTLNIINEIQQKHENVISVSEPDKGIYDALNKGIEKASGNIVGFLHSDDFFASNQTISNIVKAFKTDDIDGVYGDLHYINSTNSDKIVRNWKSKPFSDDLLKQGWMPAHPTLFLKKAVYNKHGLFNLNFKIAADYDLMLRIFKDKSLQFNYLPEVITKMRVGGASNRSLKNIWLKTREDYMAVKGNKLENPALVICSKNLSKIPQLFKK
ncbi:glycosyltransferase (GT2) [Formosa agariphila KMM 3901]|uniref:Glycosyltransferase (GT2) n=1 Tax=Formosa agariphila (strain DSM 15362 / KCTC 12365 / LMG 23005 / KMM 3901 / M-2Alg 35-1) TaxID=1347342 RepID=T2KRH4_FORAG|nr:glycosyltransferase family 2 protein [Formosa agariphila]CDF80619.1 glycosyltransferase (GT2) [Formosa agariphila KMM 3901]